MKKAKPRLHQVVTRISGADILVAGDGSNFTDDQALANHLYKTAYEKYRLDCERLGLKYSPGELIVDVQRNFVTSGFDVTVKGLVTR